MAEGVRTTGWKRIYVSVMRKHSRGTSQKLRLGMVCVQAHPSLENQTLPGANAEGDGPIRENKGRFVIGAFSIWLCLNSCAAIAAERIPGTGGAVSQF